MEQILRAKNGTESFAMPVSDEAPTPNASNSVEDSLLVKEQATRRSRDGQTREQRIGIGTTAQAVAQTRVRRHLCASLEMGS